MKIAFILFLIFFFFFIPIDSYSQNEIKFKIVECYFKPKITDTILFKDWYQIGEGGFAEQFIVNFKNNSLAYYDSDVQLSNLKIEKVLFKNLNKEKNYNCVLILSYLGSSNELVRMSIYNLREFETENFFALIDSENLNTIYKFVLTKINFNPCLDRIVSDSDLTKQ